MNKILVVIAVVLCGSLIVISGKYNTISSDIALSKELLTSLTQSNEKLEDRIARLEDSWRAFQAAVITTQSQERAEIPQAAPTIDPDKIFDIPIEHSPIFGAIDSPILAVEFIDFKCPFCAKYHPSLKAAVQEYSNQAALMVKHFPLGNDPLSRRASHAAFAAGEQGKYFEMVDLLLANSHSISQALFEKLALQLKLDISKFRSDLSNKAEQYNRWIASDVELGNSLHVHGTPTFFVNGRVSYARDIPAFRKLFDEILKKQTPGEDRSPREASL